MRIIRKDKQKMTNLYQQWRDIAEAERTQEAGEKFWNDYFEAETENYKKLLADHEKVYSGKISELAPMFNMDESLGYALAELNGVIYELEKIGMENYFDYEKYGRDAKLNGVYIASNNIAIL